MKTVLLGAGIIVGMALTGMSAQAQQINDRPDFATLDVNSDGQLTQDELAAAGAARFATIDTDGNGTISVEELATQAEGRAADRAARVLGRLDANEDGVLSQDELPQRDGRRMTRMFDRVDANDDGTISEEEFDSVKDRGRGGKDRGHKRGHGQRDRG